jgi:hypothetical protein
MTLVSHLFGLYHNFQDGCNGGDGIADIPTKNSNTVSAGCPGLLPYDKDCNLFNPTLTTKMNFGNNVSCGGEMDVCLAVGSTNTCAACCTDCRTYLSLGISISQDNFPNYPACCTATAQPRNTCSNKGINPKNNAMSYVSRNE